MRCRKRGYRDELAAMCALTRINPRRCTRPKDEVRQYECQRCGRWHLTSQRERERADVRR